MRFTENTRPRISSGVCIWIRVCRMTVETRSPTPTAISATIERTRLVRSPNTIVATAEQRE
jgi:hypothetical protein